MPTLPVEIEQDEDVLAALRWLGQVSGDAAGFWRRLERAQQAYRRLAASPQLLGQDLDLSALGADVVGSFLAQTKSLLDDRRAFDIALASRCIPWVKQMGVNVGHLGRTPGAAERARRMLADNGCEPDGALLELVMAGNYAADGLDVAFIEEEKGRARTPDLNLSLPGLAEPVAVEFKRLRRGKYETDERDRHKRIFRQAATLIDQRRLSVAIDVNYKKELQDVPESYLADWLGRSLSSQVVTLGHYPWQDDFGSGEIRPANLEAVRDDTRNSSLYFGTKMARLLSGRPIRESTYHLAAGGKPDGRDPRYIDEIYYGSVVAWECTAPRAIERKARHVKAKLVEADRQLKAHGVGIIHLAMDVEVGCDSSDLRRERNKEVILQFLSESLVAALYVHYLVPRVSESHSWLVDETVDNFGAGRDPVPSMRIFPGSAPIGNDLPAWRQKVPLPK